MRQQWMIVMAALLFLLAGCQGNDWTVSVKTTPFYKEGTTSLFAVAIQKDGKPAGGLEVTAVFEMANMDHGQIVVQLAEKEPGLYEGNVQLPMDGEWDALLQIKDGDETVEKLVTLKVKKQDVAAMINGTAITAAEVKFYQTRWQIEISSAMEAVKKQYRGEELNERLSYWKRQLNETTEPRSAVTRLIELHSMALLAEEKGYSVDEPAVDREVENRKRQYEGSETAQTLIRQYGEAAFWKQERRYVQLVLLAQNVWNDMVEQVKNEHPNVTEAEMRFLAQKKYDELLVSQIDSLSIQLYLSGR
ncbi:FixH family protein [Geobacillus stearothermophilus]|uniref:FixH family protein n=1 Tax=Geobacillus stearothermophilus TaxID=1422 RepID=UPI001F214111|nr:FixH family protein [Geobacillus stearothermophilus]